MSEAEQMSRKELLQQNTEIQDRLVFVLIGYMYMKMFMKNFLKGSQKKLEN